MAMRQMMRGEKTCLPPFTYYLGTSSVDACARGDDRYFVIQAEGWPFISVTALHAEACSGGDWFSSVTNTL